MGKQASSEGQRSCGDETGDEVDRGQGGMETVVEQPRRPTVSRYLPDSMEMARGSRAA